MAASLPPLAALVLIHLALVVARIELGRWPDRSWSDGWDHPDTLNGVKAVYAVAGPICDGLLLFICGAVALLLLGLLLDLRARHGRRRRRSAVLLGTVWLAFFVLAIWDPAGAFAWFMDS